MSMWPSSSSCPLNRVGEAPPIRPLPLRRGLEGDPDEGTSRTAGLWPATGPFVMVSTRDNGKSDVMTMGFHMMIRHDPPLIGCVTGPRDHSFHALRKTSECGIAVPGPHFVETVVNGGNCSAAKVDGVNSSIAGRSAAAPRSCFRSAIVKVRQRHFHRGSATPPISESDEPRPYPE